MELIKIPAERVPILLETKKRLELQSKANLEVNIDGEITITGESAEEFFLKDVIKAIGRGFDPNDAEKLFDEKYILEIIDLKDLCKNEKDLKRVKGRIIGERGKMKTEIESATESKISVYGRTVGIIAPLDNMHYAHKAVYKIIEGSRLESVFNDLAKYRREILGNRLLGK